MKDFYSYMLDNKFKFSIRKRKKVLEYNLGGNRQLIRVYELLYKNSNISLERKRLKFEQLISQYE